LLSAGWFTSLQTWNTWGDIYKRKFLIRDTGRTQLFDGQITTYDGLTGKYSVYFPCDGKTVYIYLDDKDVIFS